MNRRKRLLSCRWRRFRHKLRRPSAEDEPGRGRRSAGEGAARPVAVRPHPGGSRIQGSHPDGSQVRRERIVDHNLPPPVYLFICVTCLPVSPVCVQGPGGGSGDGGGLVSEGGLRLGRGQRALRGVRQDAAGRPQQSLIEGQEERPAAGIPAALELTL